MIGSRKFRTRQARLRERKRLVVSVTLWTLGGALLLVLLGVAAHQPFARIARVDVMTDGALTPAVLSAKVLQMIGGTFAGLVPRDSVVLVSPVAIARSLERAFPRIKSVSVGREGLTALAVRVTERVPKALWCGDVVPPIAYTATDPAERAVADSSWGTCYLMDEAGYIYARAPGMSGDVLPRYYGPLEKGEPIGQAFIAATEFVNWQQFYGELATDKLGAHAVLLVDDREAEIYLVNGLRLLVARHEDKETLRAQLDALLASDVIDLSRPVEYVDMRFGDKAYVKYADTPGNEDPYTLLDATGTSTAAGTGGAQQ